MEQFNVRGSCFVRCLFLFPMCFCLVCKYACKCMYALAGSAYIPLHIFIHSYLQTQELDHVCLSVLWSGTTQIVGSATEFAIVDAHARVTPFMPISGVLPLGGRLDSDTFVLLGTRNTLQLVHKDGRADALVPGHTPALAWSGQPCAMGALAYIASLCFVLFLLVL